MPHIKSHLQGFPVIAFDWIMGVVYISGIECKNSLHVCSGIAIRELKIKIHKTINRVFTLFYINPK